MEYEVYSKTIPEVQMFKGSYDECISLLKKNLCKGYGLRFL